MPKYYRVNLKDKENNIIYPNVHNKWIFSSDGSLKIDSGSITLQNGNIYLNGNSSFTGDSTTKLIFGNNTTQYIVLRANTDKSLVISDSLSENSYSIEYNRNNTSFSSTIDNIFSLGTRERRWKAIYSSFGLFYGDIYRKVNEIDATLSNNNISTQIWPTTFNIMDKNERIVNRIECIPCSNGNIESFWYLRNYGTDGTMVAQKGIKMTINKSGTLTYSIADPANFRSAISAVNKAGDTMTDSLIIQKQTSATVTYTDKQNPRITFKNSDGSQAVSLIFTDYDTYKNPYGLTLIGNGQSTANGGAYLKVEGDIQSSTLTSNKINSSLTTGTHINGNKGVAIINSTAANNGGYTMLASMKSRNGVWTLGAWDTSFNLFYTANNVISAGTNSYTKRVTLLNESGDSSFPGKISATGINGYASYPQGFGSKTSSQTWGNQDGTFVTGWSATGSSDIAFRANGGQLNVIIDGYYYCNEGKGRCTYSLDSSVRNMYANTIGTWNSNYSKYVNGTIMFCW